MEPTRKSTRPTGRPDFLGDKEDSDVAIGALNAKDLLVAGASDVDVAGANVFFHDDTLTLTRHDADIAAAFAAAAAPSGPRSASNGAAAGPSRPRVVSNGAAAVQSDEALIAALAGVAVPPVYILIPDSPSVTEISDDVDPNSFFDNDMLLDDGDDDDAAAAGESASSAAAAGQDAASNGASAGDKRKADDVDDDVPVFGAPAAQAAAGASFDVEPGGSTARRTVVDSTGTPRVSRWTRVDNIWTKNSA
jgi:hypothetical protein